MDKVKGAFSTPVCARKQTNGPSTIDQGFSTPCTVRKSSGPTQYPPPPMVVKVPYFYPSLLQGCRNRYSRSTGGCWTNIWLSNPHKNAVRASSDGCSILVPRVAMPAGIFEDSCHPKDFCWGLEASTFVA